MNKLAEKKLGDIITLHRGYDLPASERTAGDVPVISSSGISGFHNIAKLTGSNVITGRYGTIGEVYYHEGPCWPLNTTLYVEDFKGNNPRYVKYLLELMFSGMLSKGEDKSTVPGVDRNVLHDITLPYIAEEKTQALTIELLVHLDKAIEVNEQICREIESLAKIIYDYWFIQFDYPDEKGCPYKSSGGKMVWNDELKREIPERWSVRKLGNLISYSRGISYTGKDISDAGTPIISLASIDRSGRYIPDGIKYFNQKYDKNKVLKPYDLVMANTDMTQERAVMGKIIFVPDIFDGDVLSTHHITRINVSEELKSYLMMTTQTDWFHEFIKGFSSGTNVLGMDMIGFEDFMLIYPEERVLNAFNDAIFNMYRKIFNTYKENQYLKSLRDFLLPMLMSGQITVR